MRGDRSRWAAASVAVLGLLGICRGQTTGPFPGQWTMAFNHEVFPSGNATNHLSPFPGAQLYTADFDAPFNSVHMSLIPRGKDRGKVIVWDRREYIMKPNGSFAAGNQFWSFQCWSIVDPAVNPSGPRFQNFLLPLHPIGTILPLTPPYYTLFCSGHCWSPYGDLVVAGGASSSGGGIATVMLYRPDELGQAWPMFVSPVWTNDFAGAALYGGGHGKWVYGPALNFDRYYPTVTMSHRLAATGFKEVAEVFGGTVDLLNFNFGSNPTWNTFESLILEDPSTVPVGLTRAGMAGTFEGPDAGAQNMLLEEYPRMHLLGNGTMYMSGYEALSAKTQLETPPTVPGTWNYDTGQTSTGQTTTPPSFVHRHDGSSVLFARADGLTNFVGRVGGFENGVGTVTCEFILDAAGAPGTPWIKGPDMVHPRGWLNAVVLPDASVVAIGGAASTTPPVPLVGPRDPEIYKNGSWSLVSPATTPRGYHATSLLLPDGRVMVGGGEHRHDFGSPSFDYEVYEPWYMAMPRPSITSVSQSPSLGTNPDGSLRVQYGAPLEIHYDLPKFVSPGKLVLMAPGSITHHSDMHARYVELQQDEIGWTQYPTTATVVCSMPSEQIAPRGFYMLFALTAGGVPSVAQWIQIVQ